MSTSKQHYEQYRYGPSMPAAIVFIVLFAVLSMMHSWKLYSTKTWFFIPFLVGAIFEVIGYVGRTISANETPDWTTGPYIVQTLFILLAPALLAASIYMVLGRIIRLVDGEEYALIRSTWLTKVIVAGDVLSFLMQASGGGILASAKDMGGQKTGQNIIVGGLVVQVLFFGFFILLCSLFHYRILRRPTLRSQTIDVPWKRQIYVLYAASVLIMLRSIFRVVEYVQGQNGVLLRKEAYLYVFDSTLMFLVLCLFSIWHPSDVIARDIREKALRDSDERLQEEGKFETRAHTVRN